MTAFILIAIGVAALWGVSMAGGIGGESGRSIWWGVLILPYLVGWSIGIWGPGSPRWLLVLGLVVGLWYLAIPAMVLFKGAGRLPANVALIPIMTIGAIGVLTIVGCIGRLVQRTSQKPPENPEV